jgi:hypothetical protein
MEKPFRAPDTGGGPEQGVYLLGKVIKPALKN